MDNILLILLVFIAQELPAQKYVMDAKFDLLALKLLL